MNIVQIHHKSKFYLDSVRSPRFPYATVDKAINTAINTIVNDRYDSIRKADREGTFQVSQRLRDEVYTLVQPGTVLPSGTQFEDTVYNIKTAYPDYWLLASMKVSISGKDYPTIPTTYDEWNVLENNPFSRASIEYPSRVYRNEFEGGVMIRFGEVGVPGPATIFYLKEPVQVKLGHVVSGEIIDAGTPMICYMDGVVQDGPQNYVTLQEGDEYTPANDTTVVSGIFVINFINCDLPTMLHEEVCKEAAKVLSGTVENYERVKDLDQQQNLGGPTR